MALLPICLPIREICLSPRALLCVYKMGSTLSLLAKFFNTFEVKASNFLWHKGLPALQAGAPQVQGCIEHPSAHKALGSSQLSVLSFLGPCSTSHLVLFFPKELARTQPGLFGGVCCFVFLVSKKFTYKLIFKRVSFLAFTPPFFLSIVLRLSLEDFSVLHCQAVRVKTGPHLTH